MTLTARSDGQVVAGVELWQQQRDRYWFLEMLIRDQARIYAGVGAEVAKAAIAWLSRFLRETGSPYGVRVHAMAQEERAVKFWTSLTGRGPDFDDAYQRAGEFRFPAVGWVIIATSPAQAQRPSKEDA
jgi:NAD(P)-dependent dehydrogenase (short-subunit alcohol dehydrogenase family)